MNYDNKNRFRLLIPTSRIPLQCEIYIKKNDSVLKYGSAAGNGQRIIDNVCNQ